MAKQLESYKFVADRRRVYDWDNWFNGKPWMLVLGTDFKCAQKSMTSGIYREARQRGLAVRIDRLDSGDLVIQARPLTNTEE